MKISSLCEHFYFCYMNIFLHKNIFSSWTFTTVISWTFPYVNKFPIWTFFFSYEHYSYMNKFYIELIQYLNNFLVMNNYTIWTNFLYEHFYYVINFHIWTLFVYKKVSYKNFFLCEQVSYMIFLSHEHYLYMNKFHMN
jgi:hypothetical protein